MEPCGLEGMFVKSLGRVLVALTTAIRALSNTYKLQHLSGVSG